MTVIDPRRPNHRARNGTVLENDFLSGATLPSEQVREALARAAVDNAERPLQDACRLLEAGSAPTAHSLAVLAMEEVGKVVICDRLGGKDEQSTTRAEFLSEIRRHTAKLQIGSTLENE